ncbi:MAG: ketoacyl-ACP synthase III [Cyclobacteriaceae bacterium]|nr:ketoacyl-ACP synthase III [Cyclobacteriaceae bacterium]MCH8515350.1 ketoacyl-ACP synthase III [Cyclobacteriaceae bacterium]
MNEVIISGTGSALPSRKLSNAYFNEKLGEDVGTWLEENLTIVERRWLSEGESVADLCETAAKKALEAANIQADKLDLIIVATDTPEYLSPSTSSILQHRLRASKAGSFDLNSACAGFVSAADTAAKYIKADDQYEHILVIGAYGMSRHLNPRDKKTVTLFADGAGAAIFSASKDRKGYLTAHQFTQGQYNEWMGIYAGGVKEPVTQEVLQSGRHQLQFVKRFPSELNPSTWAAMAKRLAKDANIELSDVKSFLMTQININAIKGMLDILQLPHDRAPYIMSHYGYTGSSAIPIALDEAIRSGELQKGDTFFMIGSGGGLSFAGAAFKL